jgi:hypothetical protein
LCGRISEPPIRHAVGNGLDRSAVFLAGCRFPLPGRRAARGGMAVVAGLSVPPGADSFRSCGKNRKKGTPKGRALHKAALPFGIPSSVICHRCALYLLPCASPAPGRAAQLRSVREIAAGASPRPTKTGQISHWPVGNGLDRSAKKDGVTAGGSRPAPTAHRIGVMGTSGGRILSTPTEHRIGVSGRSRNGQDRSLRVRIKLRVHMDHGMRCRIYTPTFPNRCDCAARPEAGNAHGNA